MKKIIYLIIVITVMASVAACGNKNEASAPQATIAEDVQETEPSKESETAESTQETKTEMNTVESTQPRETEVDATEGESETEQETNPVVSTQITAVENSTTPEPVDSVDSELNQIQTTETTLVTQTESEAEAMDTRTMNIQIGDTILTATLEDNEAANALKKLMADGGLTIQFSGYGGFEQVGSIGSSLPTNDVQISTSAGDIMLYSGNRMVMFYGNHSWAYTRLGKIDNASASDLESLLGNGDITATFSLAE
ncbi:MAG: cyclophilin-like fold protein [Lachnospiraceae bacterium]|nr:cyclophilin-like fold protein [Lachnospiraceae bacterium]